MEKIRLNEIGTTRFRKVRLEWGGCYLSGSISDTKALNELIKLIAASPLSFGHPIVCHFEFQDGSTADKMLDLSPTKEVRQ